MPPEVGKAAGLWATLAPRMGTYLRWTWIPLLVWLPLACGGHAPKTVGTYRSVQGPGGSLLQVPDPLTGLMPANGAVLDFVAEFVGPEGVVAMPLGTLEYSNLVGDERARWSRLPIVADLQLEELISAKVDFLIGHDWQEPQLKQVLGRAGLGALYLPTVRSFEDLEQSLTWVGKVLDREPRAQELVQQLRALKAQLATQGAPLAERTAMVYSNYGAGGGTSGSGTSYDLMIQLAGLRNAATVAGIEGHVDLDIEGLLSIQPDFLILTGAADGSSTSLDSLKQALGAAPLTAIEKGWVVLLPPNQLTTASHHLVYAAQGLQEQALRLLKL